MLKWWFALYVDQWVDLNLSASLLRIGLDGSAVDLLLRVVYCLQLSGFLIGGSVVRCDGYDSRLSLCCSFTTFTDWKVVPMAIVPLGKISVYDCSVTTLRVCDNCFATIVLQFSLFDDQLPG